MQTSADVCSPAAEADLAETCFPPASDATCLGEALAPRQALTAATDAAGEQNQAPQLLWVGEQLWHEPQEEGDSRRQELIPLQQVRAAPQPSPKIGNPARQVISTQVWVLSSLPT